MRILSVLEAEGEGLPLLVWQLTEDVHALASVLGATAAGVPLHTAVRNARVWGKRQNALERAARRVRSETLMPLLAVLARLDGLAKGIGKRCAPPEVGCSITAGGVLPDQPIIKDISN